MTSNEGHDLINNLNFSKNLDELDSLERATCAHCNKARRYYCYTCMKPMGNSTPQIQLPMKTVILQHPKEKKGKSTAIHAKIIAPEWVEIYQYPEVPDYINENNAVLLYPGKHAITVPELVEKNKERSENNKIEYVVFIDSTWQQSKCIFRDEKVAKLPCVKIADQKTLFWRYQSFGDSFLATIEAIFYFFKEFNNESHQFDDLLYFYAHQYKLIQDRYRNDTSIKFNHKQNYINYEQEEQANKRQKIEHQ
ncbi:hypothetical protein AKO1_013594 [Acrasis kona]|uniref:tRNA-uridine aminocarboxypropyltransferase 1 n=1 Tax=Acrasis kona TaxID=1008807 RepID=A0AAW2YV50_9EUKA